jgi:hypothetical protein
MTPGPNLMDQFADLVGGAGNPRRLAERTLEVVMALVNGRSAGAFVAADERLTLFASRGIDQHVLDAVETLWHRGKGELESGRPLYIPECRADRDLGGAADGAPASVALFPVLQGGALVALLYADSAVPHFCEPGDIERLAQFSRVLAGAVRPPAVGSEADAPAGESRARWEAYLERTPVADIERQKLVLLLNRNKWNIARVARLMGVTRRTIYLRLQRYKIARERVYKTRFGSATAS